MRETVRCCLLSQLLILNILTWQFCTWDIMQTTYNCKWPLWVKNKDYVSLNTKCHSDNLYFVLLIVWLKNIFYNLLLNLYYWETFQESIIDPDCGLVVKCQRKQSDGSIMFININRANHYNYRWITKSKEQIKLKGFNHILFCILHDRKYFIAFVYINLNHVTL